MGTLTASRQGQRRSQQEQRRGHQPPRRPPQPPKQRRGRGRGTIAIGISILLAAAAATVGFSDLVVTEDETEEVRSRRRARTFWRTFEIQSLDGTGNNRRHPEWGVAGQPYLRVAPADYADGLSEPQAGPASRFISNRVFNDTNRNVFSENTLSQWTFVWGQFTDHNMGLVQGGDEEADMPFDAADPLESFTNDAGVLPFTRSAAAPGTGETTPREQINTLNSYIDGDVLYSNDVARLEWLREGPVDGDMSNNGAKLRLDENGLLPRADILGDPASAPAMDLDGRMRGTPEAARIAGDKRANESLDLTATHTLFAREHNRIVDELPDSLSEERKFQLARRVVIAEIQYITYREYLPTMGVDLPRYRGYRSRTNATVSNEFATVGYRAHSLIHGDVELTGATTRYTTEQLAAIEAQGIEIERAEDGSTVHFTVPLNLAFFNPDLVEQLQLGPLLQGIGVETQYNNDEMIDNQLRSVMFQIPTAANPACLDGAELPDCFQGVIDLGALDVERGRDHGMPSYNDMREAYGLDRIESFTDLTGEDTDQFPADPELTAGDEVNDPDSIDFMTVTDAAGLTEDANLEERVGGPAVEVVKRTTLASRLRAIFGDVDSIDAFTGMVSEAHVEGTEFGELQLAMWRQQFTALRDGDRFFYGNDPGLRDIRRIYGIDFRTNLGDVIARNTDIPREEMDENVFLVPAA